MGEYFWDGDIYENIQRSPREAPSTNHDATLNGGV